MSTDLDKLKKQLPAEIESRGFVVFHGQSRADLDTGVVFWDTNQQPNYSDFLDCAHKLNVKVIVLNSRALEKAAVDDVQEELDAFEIPREERRDLERRLKALRPYCGFTGTVELSFDFNGAIYLFELRSEFMNELLAVMNELDNGLFPPAGGYGDDEPDPGPGGSFFSRN